MTNNVASTTVDFLVDSARLIYTTLWLMAFGTLMALVVVVVLVCNGFED